MLAVLRHTSAADGRRPAPGVVGEAGSLRVAAELVRMVAQVLQGNQDVVGPINQKVITVFWLGWLSAHSLLWHCNDDKTIQNFARLKLHVVFVYFESTYRSLALVSSTCRHSGRRQSESRAVQSRDRSGK